MTNWDLCVQSVGTKMQKQSLKLHQHREVPVRHCLPFYILITKTGWPMWCVGVTVISVQLQWEQQVSTGTGHGIRRVAIIFFRWQQWLFISGGSKEKPFSPKSFKKSCVFNLLNFDAIGIFTINYSFPHLITTKCSSKVCDPSAASCRTPLTPVARALTSATGQQQRQDPAAAGTTNVAFRAGTSSLNPPLAAALPEI